MLETLSTISLAAVLAGAAASPVPSHPRAGAAPPIGVNVSVAPGVRPTVVSLILEEADAIWRGTGFTFAWQRGADGLPAQLRVTIENDGGHLDESVTPLGWIRFDGPTAPESEIHLSFGNAAALLEVSNGVVGTVRNMTVTERDTMLGRALGRALAHELGHYLLGTKAHTSKGLLKARRSAVELFSPGRQGFAIDAAQRETVAARLNQSPVTARNRAIVGER